MIYKAPKSQKESGRKSKLLALGEARTVNELSFVCLFIRLLYINHYRQTNGRRDNLR